jgi:hypothetical protein
MSSIQKIPALVSISATCTGWFIKTWPVTSTYISNPTLYAVTNQVPYVTDSFGFPGKVVVLLPAADWRCIREWNKMASPQEKCSASAWRVGQAGHEAMAWMWNELQKLLHAARKSPVAEPVNIHSCMAGSEGKFACEAIQSVVTSSSSDNKKNLIQLLVLIYLVWYKMMKVSCLKCFLIMRRPLVCLAR